MHDSWLDDALRGLDGARVSPGFAERVAQEAHRLALQRRARFRLALISSSALAAAAACALLLFSPEREVTADELAALRAELSLLRAELPDATLELGGSESGELKVDMEALLTTSAGWSGDDSALETFFVVEGGQL